MNTSAKVILFPQETKQGFPLKIRITLNRKSTYIGLNYYLTRTEKARYWNSDNNILRTSYPHYQHIQSKVDDILKKRKIDVEEEESVKTYMNNRSFSKYLDETISALETKGLFGSVQKLKTVRLHLSNFRTGDILFSYIDIDFLKEFKLFLYKKSVKPISQKAYFERIRKLLNNAIKEDKYNPRKHPFASFEFDKVVSTPKSLTSKQLEAIEKGIKGKLIIINTKENKTETLTLSKKAKEAGFKFIFQYYAFGMRVSDLILLKWENFYDYGKRLKYMMFKTKNEVDILLTDNLLYVLFYYLPKNLQIEITNRNKAEKPESSEIVKKIGDTEIKFNRLTNWYHLISSYIHQLSIDDEYKCKYVFNMLPNEKMTEKLIYSRIQTNTSYYNQDLKLLADEVYISEQITFKLSSHTARHTFADIARLSGQSIYDISKALNHKSISTTEKYLNNFKSHQLDNKFFNEKVKTDDGVEINKKLRELLNSSDYEKKAAIVKILNELM